MNSITHTSHHVNISSGQRLNRLLLAAALISLASSTALSGFTALLPLLAIYPLVTGFIGWDPVRDWQNISHRADGYLSVSERSEAALIGVVLVGSAFIPAINSAVLLPLAGIFPLIIAVLGEDVLAGLGRTYTAISGRPAPRATPAVAGAKVQTLRTPRRAVPQVKAA